MCLAFFIFHVGGLSECLLIINKFFGFIFVVFLRVVKKFRHGLLVVAQVRCSCLDSLLYVFPIFILVPP